MFHVEHSFPTLRSLTFCAADRSASVGLRHVDSVAPPRSVVVLSSAAGGCAPNGVDVAGPARHLPRFPRTRPPARSLAHSLSPGVAALSPNFGVWDRDTGLRLQGSATTVPTFPLATPTTSGMKQPRTPEPRPPRSQDGRPRRATEQRRPNQPGTEGTREVGVGSGNMSSIGGGAAVGGREGTPDCGGATELTCQRRGPPTGHAADQGCPRIWEGSDLEQRAFGGNARAPRIGLGAGEYLGQLPDSELSVRPSPIVSKPENLHPISRPAPIRILRVRRLADQQYAAHPKKRCRTLCSHRRRTEAAAHHRVEGAPKVWVPAEQLGAALHHIDAIGETSDVGNHPSKELAAANPHIKQGDVEIRSSNRQNQSGHAAARPQVQDLRTVGQAHGERLGMFHVERGVSRSQKAKSLARLKCLQQWWLDHGILHGEPGSYECQAGAMTTRRDGSSPSERVTTPSTSPAAS